MSYSYLYLHDLYPTVSDIDFMISLYYCSMLCIIRQLVLVHRYPLKYLNVCSSMISIIRKVGAPREIYTRVSFINVDIVSGLIKCCWMSLFSTVHRGSLQVVATLFCAIVILHV